MRYPNNNTDRHTLRLSGFDYSRPGIYFITICVQNRECLFGKITNGQMHLNNAGLIVQSEWYEIQNHFGHINLDAHVIMPDHMHGIIEIDMPIAQDAETIAQAALGKIIRRFKSISAIKVNTALHRRLQPLWQRNYWERIIRDEKELKAVRNYINHNPMNWQPNKM